MSLNLRLSSTAVTHEGLVRTANEDSLIVRDDVQAWVVADGMGGYANGQWASSTLTGSVGAAVLTGDFDADTQALSDAIHHANQLIFDTANSHSMRMGSTVVCLYIADERFACFWAGDSRIYLLRAGQLYRLTRDHTQVQDMVEAGLLSAEEAKRHPMGHVLSRAIGVQAQVQLDAVSDRIAPRDVFLLCSDGLTGVVSDAEIAERLAGFEPATACRRLLDLVLARGAPDNVTLLAVICDETTVLSLGGVGA